MKSDDSLLRMLTTHVLNVTSLMEDAQIFFMVRYKEDAAERRRFWFARGNLRKDFLLHGLKNHGVSDNEIDATAMERDLRHSVLQPAEVRDQDELAGRNDIDDDEDDPCPVRKGVGGPTMNRIAKDDEDDEDDGEEGISCATADEDIDECDAFPMLVQGEDDVSSAFDGMRSVKPVEEDDDNDDGISGLATRTESEDDTLHVNATLQPLPSHDLDVFPPCVGFEREEEISDACSFGIECEKLGIPEPKNPSTKSQNKRKKKRRSSLHTLDNLATSVLIEGKRMTIKPGPRNKTAAQISPVWKFFGFLEHNGVDQFQGFTICRLCLKRVSRASHTTKGMRDHLLLWHHEIWRSVGGMTETETRQLNQQQFHPRNSLSSHVSSKRWQPTDQASSILALHFFKNEFPDGQEYSIIANKVDCAVGVVKQWFVNQRRRGFPARRYLPPEVLRCHSNSKTKTTVSFS